MTTLLERAFTKSSKLPVEQQNVVASLLLREMESEERWAELFAKSQDALAKLADEALAEFELRACLSYAADREKSLMVVMT